MFISICIPTYNSGSKLVRLLDSIKEQTFTDYEIVISDDSRNTDIKDMIEEKYSDLNILYYHNAEALGTPANWNNAVNKSRGEWIKLMHHDDWFMGKDALQKFADQTSPDHNAKMIFCAFNCVDVERNTVILNACSKFEIQLLKWNYLNLYKNFIGNPSCTLISSKLKPYEYDSRIKWLIDFDFYTWFFRKEKNFVYIHDALIAFGVHSNQVTAAVFKNPNVEIPEGFLLYEKYGIGILKNIFVYDFFWRMYRNLEIKNIAQLESYLGYTNKYSAIRKLITLQNKVSRKALNNGYISKLLMLAGFISNKFAKN